MGVWELIEAVPEDEPGPNVLLMGMPGSGKTFSIATLLKAGMEVFVIFTEQGRESLFEGLKLWGVTEEERKDLHWCSVAPSSPGFRSMRKVMHDINTKEQKDLQGEKMIGQSKEFNQMLDMVDACGKFIDQHGEDFGDVTTWSNKRALVVDGLSSINDMCMDLVVGAKPIKTIADWGMAMDAEMRFLKQLVHSTTCTFVLLAHLELNKDEVSGKIHKAPKLLGQKNTYDFGKYFSDVLLCEDKGNNTWTWTANKSNMQLKTRNLDYSKSLEPNFVPLLSNWAARYSA